MINPNRFTIQLAWFGASANTVDVAGIYDLGYDVSLTAGAITTNDIGAGLTESDISGIVNAKMLGFYAAFQPQPYVYLDMEGFLAAYTQAYNISILRRCNPYDSSIPQINNWDCQLACYHMPDVDWGLSRWRFQGSDASWDALKAHNDSYVTSGYLKYFDVLSPDIYYKGDTQSIHRGTDVLYDDSLQECHRVRTRNQLLAPMWNSRDSLGNVIPNAEMRRMFRAVHRNGCHGLVWWEQINNAGTAANVQATVNSITTLWK